MPGLLLRLSFMLFAALLAVSPNRSVLAFQDLVPEPSAAVESSTNPVRIRLRISWGGGSPTRWQGTIRFSDATIGDPSVLGMNTDSAAAINVRRQVIEVRQVSASPFEGIEISVDGFRDSQIQIELNNEGRDDGVVHKFALSELIAETRVFPLDDQENRVSVSRAPGDRIRFATRRAHLVFQPNELFAFEFGANLLLLKDAKAEFSMQVVPARSSAAAVTSKRIDITLDETGSTSPQAESIQVPASEGVYDLKMTIQEPAANGLLRTTRPAVTTRTVQFVVLDDKAKHQTSPPDWNLVAEIDPGSLRPSVADPLNQLTRIIGIGGAQGALGTFDVSADEGKESVVLPVGGWLALPLKISQPGQLHRIEIEFEKSPQTLLGCSILEVDESGQVRNFGCEAGVYVPDSIVDREGGKGQSQAGRHQFTFWPTSEQAVLLVANRSLRQSVTWREIRLLVKAVSNAKESQSMANAKAGEGNRRLMAFCEQPLFCENFAAHDVIDPQLGQSVNDWLTFYQGADRLIEQLKRSGAGGAFINVYGAGSSLLPMTSTNVTPRFDSGVFSSGGSDPMRKDVVELLFRLFERDGLKLVPVVSLDHRLAAIEFQPNDSQVIDYRQQQISADDQEELPVYNPFSPRVQAAAESIVAEIAQRYSSRPSWQGLAVVCRPDCWTLLPGSRIAGFDAETVGRFAQTVPELGDRIIEPAELLTPEFFPRWLAWRSNQMAIWYGELANEVTSRSVSARLYLPLIDVFRTEEIASVLAPALHRSPNFSDAMNRLGFNSEALKRTPGIVLMRPNRLAPIDGLASQKTEFTVQRTRQMDQWFAELDSSASLFSHRGSWARFEKLEGSPYFPRQESPIVRLQHLCPAGIWNRQRFARAILDTDARLLLDGGLLLNSTDDAELREFLKVYSALPDQKFESTPHASQPNEVHPVAVRWLNQPEGTYLYLVNASPWEVSVTVEGGGEIRNVLTSFGRTDWLAIRADEKPGQFQVKLAPFELLGGMVTDRNVRFSQYQYELPETAFRDLNTTYYLLRSRLTAAGNAAPMNVLENAGFEYPEINSGWTTGGQATEFLQRDTQDPHDGNASLKIDNRLERSVWIRSNTFAPPTTGRLSISVWLKSRDPSLQPPLRISVESSDSGSGYYRFGEVGSLNADRQQNQLTGGWKQFAVHFDDLPQISPAGLRIGFDMMGPGEVWIDKVQVYDRWLDENDVKAMTQVLAGIGPLMQQTEKMERCRQVLSGYWPTFLRENFDDAERSTEWTADPADELPARSTMRQKFRRIVSPGIFQFR